ncbi:MAG: DedA family protein [Candidatus Ranarchaeia archaeon]|jgi:membrane protein DedA with SNARE-associated domain
MSIFTDIAFIIIGWIQSLGWVGVFIGVLIESLIAPIPSPIIPMAGGVILIPPDISILEAFLQVFFIIGLVGAIAGTIGSTLGFILGYYGGKPVIERWGKWFAVNWDEVNRWGRKIEEKNRGGPLVFTARAVPVVPMVIISFAAGAIRYEPKRFFLWTFLGSLPRNLILGMLGWSLGAAYGGWASLLETWENAILIIIVVAVVLYFVIVKIRNRALSKALE